MKLNPYSEYKDSGYPHIGEIPSHWEVFRNGRLFSQRNETGFRELPILEVSLRTGVRVRDMENMKRKQVLSDRDKYKRAVSGDIAYNMMRMWQGAVGTAPVDGLISPAYVVAKPFSHTVSQYYSYLFRTKAYMSEVDAYSRGIVKDRNRLYWQDFKVMPSIVPPKIEQMQICRYLGWKEASIRKLIENKKGIVKLINEELVTLAYGNSNNNQIDGSREWQTLFPPHWKFMKGKRIFREKIIKNNKDKELLAVTQDRGVILKSLCTQNYVSPSGSLSGLKLVQDKDFVISLRSFQGGIEFSEYEGIVSPAYTVMTLRNEYNDARLISFYRVLFKSKNFIRLLNTVISGIRDGKNISFTDFSELDIPIPPKNELNTMLDSFNAYEKIKISTQQEIELVQEYFKQEISNIVTGKVNIQYIDVPDFEEADHKDHFDDLYDNIEQVDFEDRYDED